jgi:hypothetical protein
LVIGKKAIFFMINIPSTYIQGNKL